MKSKPQLPTNSPNLGVALWLCPKKSSALHDKLQVAMDSLATVFPDQVPRVEPHITITTNIAVDLDNAKDDVSRILSACCIALDSLPRDSVDQHWIRMGRVSSQKQFFKKLYFSVWKDPTLISFARIVRELFVILPQKIDLEQKVKNPHLFHTDSHGNIVRKKPTGLRSRSLLLLLLKLKLKKQPIDVALDMPKIQHELALEAAQWSATEYDPHLSLAYSNLHPIDSALWHTIRSRVSDYLLIEDCDLEIWDTQENGLSWDGGVLKLVLCEGDPAEWPVLGSVDLHM